MKPDPRHTAANAASRKATVDPAIVAQALRHHQAGALDKAAALYRQALAVDGRHADSLHLLGVIAHQTGQHARAIELIGKAIRINGQCAPFHSNLGLALHASGQSEKAAAACTTAIRLTPDYPDAYGNLALALTSLGRHEDAVAARTAAVRLRPNDANAHKTLGQALMALKRYEDAVAAYRAALGFGAQDAETCFDLGNALTALGRYEEALAAYAQAVRLRPTYVEAFSNLGTALYKLERFEEASGVCGAALRLQPGRAELHSNFGNTLRRLGRLDEAVAAHATALRLQPDFAMAHSNLGIALAELGRCEEALAACATAVRLEPGTAKAHSNLGIALMAAQRLDEALAMFDAAQHLDPDYAEAQFNESMIHLMRGEYARGWPKYEWRWQLGGKTGTPRSFPVPQWTGEDIAGRTILLHAEQGLGDTLQFCRYIPLLAARGASVLLEVPAPLVRLLADLPCRPVPSGTDLPPFDLHCPLMSLPHACATTLETIPAAIPYLHADPRAVLRWQQRLGSATAPRVGIVWSGNPKHRNDRNRSVPLAALARLAGAGADLVSLQKEVRPEDAAVLAAHPHIRGFAAELSDFADTAALIGALDMVVTVDTSVAHLAGALGKPVWIMLPFAPDWRWLLDRADSPWYPTARLFRQARPGDWDEVITQVTATLATVSS